MVSRAAGQARQVVISDGTKSKVVELDETSTWVTNRSGKPFSAPRSRLISLDLRI